MGIHGSGAGKQAQAGAAAEQLHVLREQHDALRGKLREAAAEADAKDRQLRDLRAQLAEAAGRGEDRAAREAAEQALAAAQQAAVKAHEAAAAQLAAAR